MFDLTGNVALITGSTRGIGKAIAEALAAAGAKVVISSRTESACKEVAAGIAERGGAAIAVPCHVGHKEQLQALVNKTLSTWGKIDVLVCNAGVNPYYGPLSGISDATFLKIMNTNVQSTLWLCNMVLPQMAARKAGSVIMISSYTGVRGTDTLGAYGISKAGVIELTRNLAVEWGASNIRVNCLIPGLILTEFSAALWENPEIHKNTVNATTLKRLGTAEDVAGAAVFFAAPASSYISGATLLVDGGLTVTSSI